MVEALDDQFVLFNEDAPILIDVLSNDSPDAELLSISNVNGGTATIVGGMIQFVPDPSFFGELTFSYQVVGSGNQSDAANVELTLARQWQSSEIATDVSGDGRTSPIDALQVINFINQYGSRDLPRIPSGAIARSGHVDVNGDGRVSSLDALLVINHLADRNRSAESELVTSDVGVDTVSLVPAQLPARDDLFEQEDPRDELFAELETAGSYSSVF